MKEKDIFKIAIITFFPLCCVLNTIKSQQIFIKVTDHFKNSIYNATVALGSQEVYVTDSFGLVLLKNKPSRNIEISSIGYKTRLITLGEGLAKNDTVQIQLEKNIVLEEPVQVSVPFNKTEKHGTVRRTLDKSGIGRLTGSIDVIEVFNYKYPSRIKSFSFFIPRYCSKNATLRLRIFHADSLGRPGADILDSSLFIKDYKTGAWNTISLDAYRLKTPKPGSFFIGLELMPSDIKANSFMLEMVKTKRENFSFYRTIMGYWGPHPNPMLKDKNYTFYVTLKTL